MTSDNSRPRLSIVQRPAAEDTRRCEHGHPHTPGNATAGRCDWGHPLIPTPPAPPLPRPRGGVLDHVRRHREDFSEGYGGKLTAFGWYAEAVDHVGQVGNALVNEQLQGGDRERYRRSARGACLRAMAVLWELHDELLVGDEEGA